MGIVFEGKGPFELPVVQTATAHAGTRRVGITLWFRSQDLQIEERLTPVRMDTTAEVAREFAATLIAAADEIAERT